MVLKRGWFHDIIHITLHTHTHTHTHTRTYTHMHTHTHAHTHAHAHTHTHTRTPSFKPFNIFFPGFCIFQKEALPVWSFRSTLSKSGHIRITHQCKNLATQKLSERLTRVNYFRPEAMIVHVADRQSLALSEVHFYLSSCKR